MKTNQSKIHADIIEGLAQSAAGEVVDLGSFEQYADEPVSEEDIRMVEGALATIEQMVSVIRHRIEP